MARHRQTVTQHQSVRILRAEQRGEFQEEGRVSGGGEGERGRTAWIRMEVLLTESISSRESGCRSRERAPSIHAASSSRPNASRPTRCGDEVKQSLINQ